MTSRHGSAHTGSLCEGEHLCEPCDFGEHSGHVDLFADKLRYPRCGLVACGCGCEDR